MKRIINTVLLSAALLTSSLGSAYAKNKHIKLGVMSGSESEVFAVAAKIAKEKYGVTVELVKFDDYVFPNEALAKGQLDANAFQHKPYLDAQSASRGYKLVVVGYTFTYPIAGYSKKYKDIKSLKKGDTVSLPNDPTNLGRGLLLLQANGLIKLKDPSGLTQTAKDVVYNPKKLKITPIDAALVSTTLNKVGLAIINTNYAQKVGLNPLKNGIIVEDKNSPYVNIIVAREDNQTDQDILDFVKAFNTEEVYQKSLKVNGNAIVKGW